MSILPNHVYAVVLAGGSGTRFWPKSRHLTPKQLCAIGSADHTMLEVTLRRLDQFIPPERRMIVTHQDQIKATKEIAGDLCANYLAEPEARNTANALALAAVDIMARHKGHEAPIMISLHADAVIKNEEEFRRCLVSAVEIAQRDYLTILGIVPTCPETGYGYIEKGAALSSAAAGFKVNSFREKPQLELAKQYLKSGNFYWNAGIFVWKVPVLLRELQEFLPVTVEKLQTLTTSGKTPRSINEVPAAELKQTYASLPKISIDNALLEVSKNVAMVAADIGWQDVGSWSALSEVFKTDEHGNLTYGDAVLIDSTGTTVDTDSLFVSCIGLKDMVVVCSKGAVLVCPKNRDQDVKKIVELLKEKGRNQLI